jgi:hypothetical protein
MIERVTVLSICLLSGGALIGCRSSQHSFDPAAPQDVNLTGTWILNAEESDDPSEQMDQMGQGAAGTSGGAMNNMTSPGGGKGGGRGGRGGRGGGGSGGGGIDPERMRETMSMVREAVRRIDLQQGDSTVTIIYDLGRASLLYTDGRKLEQELRGGAKMEIRAGWKGEYFIVERKIDGGGKIKEEYMIPTGTGQLFVITRLEIDRMPQPIEFRRVYDAASDSRE